MPKPRFGTDSHRPSPCLALYPLCEGQVKEGASNKYKYWLSRYIWVGQPTLGRPEQLSHDQLHRVKNDLPWLCHNGKCDAISQSLREKGVWPPSWGLPQATSLELLGSLYDSYDHNKYARTTPDDGYLGSWIDEERSEMRYVMRIAELRESSNS